MPKIKRIEIENGLVFEKLSLDLDSSGLNLITGVNYDDKYGDDSKNGTGKSSILKLIDGHFFENTNELKNTDFIMENTKVGFKSTMYWDDYVTCVYKKHKELGGNGLTFKTLDDTNLTNYNDPNATRSNIIQKLNLNRIEWDFLVSLMDISNDVNHPFFNTSKKNLRMDLIQSLYGLDYETVHAENLLKLKGCIKEVEKLNIELNTSNTLIETQLADMPTVNELTEILDSSAIKSAELKQEVDELTTLKNSLNLAKNTIERYTHLETSLAEYKDQDISLILSSLEKTYKELSLNLNNLRDISHKLEVLEGYRSEYNIKYKTFEEIPEIPNVSSVIDNLHVEIANQDRIKHILAQYSKSYLYLESIDLSVTPEVTASFTDKQNKLEVSSLKLKEDKQLNFNLSIKLSSVKKLIQDKENYQVKLKVLDNLLVKVDSLTLTKELQSLSHKRDEIVKYLSALTISIEGFNSGKCPTCSTPWDSSIMDNYGESVKNLKLYNDKLNEIEKNINILQESQPLMFKFEAILNDLSKYDESMLSMPESHYTDIIGNIDTTIASNKIELDSIKITTENLKILSTLNPSDFDVLKNNVNVDNKNLDLDLKAELNKAKKYKLLYDELILIHNRIEEYLDTHSLKNYSLPVVQEQINKIFLDNETCNASIKSFNNLMLLQTEYKSSVYKDISIYKGIISTENSEVLSVKLVDISTAYEKVLGLYYETKTKMDGRNKMEKQLEDLNIIKNKILNIENNIDVYESIKFLTGPEGLVISRINDIFETINFRMNYYLAQLIKDGVHSNKNFQAKYMTHGKYLELKIYINGKERVKRALSKSEKARVKIASCLAFREYMPNNKLANLLYLDEIDSSMCDTNTERVWDCIKLHQETMPSSSIFCISHSEKMQNSSIWNKVITVVKENGIASVRG